MLDYITTFTHSSSGNKFFCLRNCRLHTVTPVPFLLKACVTMDTGRDCISLMIFISKDYDRCTSDLLSCLTLPVLQNYILIQHLFKRAISKSRRKVLVKYTWSEYDSVYVLLNTLTNWYQKALCLKVPSIIHHKEVDS